MPWVSFSARAVRVSRCSALRIGPLEYVTHGRRVPLRAAARSRHLALSQALSNRARAQPVSRAHAYDAHGQGGVAGNLWWPAQPGTLLPGLGESLPRALADLPSFLCGNRDAYVRQ